MIKETQTWDIRCTQELTRFFPVRRGCWFKVSRKQARRLLRILARAYKVKTPKLDDNNPVTAKGDRHNGWYRPAIQTISIWSRAHVKTVFHEFYHHLDEVTKGRYDSSDWPTHRLTFHNQRTTPASYAWQFAEKLFNLLREYKPGVYTEEEMAKKDPKTNPVVAHARRMSKAEEKSVKGQLKELIAKSGVVPQSHSKPAADKPKETKGAEPSKANGKAAPPAKKAAGGGGIDGSKKIKIKFKENPKREGSSAHTIYELFKSSKNVEDFREKCKTRGLDAGYLNGAIRRGEIELV